VIDSGWTVSQLEKDISTKGMTSTE